MIQHINLLRTERAARRAGLQLLPVLLVTLVAIAVVLGLGWQARRSLAQEQLAANKVRAAAAAAAPASSGPAVLDDALARKLAAARARLTQMDSVSAQLRGLESGPDLAFSGLLDALARRSAEGIWLVELDADVPTRRLTMTGRALDADRIPAYLKSLDKEPLLRDRDFQTMNLKELDLAGGTRSIEFRLSSALAAKGGS